MIRTITLDAGYEKRVYAGRYDGMSYQVQHVENAIYGEGVNASIILKQENVEAKAYLLASHKHAAFIREILDDLNVRATILETPGTGNECIRKMEANTTVLKHDDIANAYVALLDSVLKCEIQSEDQLIFTYHHQDLDAKNMETFLKTCQKASLSLLSLHPMYWDALKTIHNVLFFCDEKTCKEYFKLEEADLKSIAQHLLAQIAPLCRMIVYCQDNAHWLWIMGERMIYVEYHGVTSGNIYPEALVASLAQSIQQDEDVKTCIENSIASAIGMALAMGKMPTQESLGLLKQQIRMIEV